MSAHVLLNLLKELRKRDKCVSCRGFSLFSQHVQNIQYYRCMNVRFYLSHDI